MNYLLDTNVVSEWVKPRPNPRVVRWLDEVKEETIFLSILNFAEIHQGIEHLPAGRRRETLLVWLNNDLATRFDGRILGIGFAVAASWGAIMTRGRKLGINLGVMDAFFAATAEVHSLTLITRNTKHFAALGIPLLNPWFPGP